MHRHGYMAIFLTQLQTDSRLSGLRCLGTPEVAQESHIPFVDYSCKLHRGCGCSLNCGVTIPRIELQDLGTVWVESSTGRESVRSW
jgi:hypothetical protein